MLVKAHCHRQDLFLRGTRKELPIILVINKIDRSDARISEVVDEVYDLFIDLDASEDQIEFPIIYTNAKIGIAHDELNSSSDNLMPLFKAIINTIKGWRSRTNLNHNF